MLSKKIDHLVNMTPFKKGGKTQAFIVFVLGLLFYGVGNFLLLNQALLLETISLEVTSLPLVSLGLVLTLLGLILLFRLFYHFYQRISDKKSLRIAVRNYLFVILGAGILLGLLGEAVYRSTSLSYEHIKWWVWVVTTYIQGIARFTFLYYCLSLLTQRPFCWRDFTFIKMITLVFLLVTLSIFLQLWIPLLGSVVFVTSDVLIAVGIVYKELF